MKRAIERLFGKFTVENLAVYLTVLIAAVSAMGQFVIPDLGFLTVERLLSPTEFWHIFFFPFRMSGTDTNPRSIFWLFLLIYIFWLFASQLEAQIGSAAFSAYCFFTMLTITAGHLLGDFLFGQYVDPYFLDLAIFAAVAYLNPEQRILLFFIVPVKLKWVAGLIFGGMVVMAIFAAVGTRSLVPFWEPVFGMLGFIIFYGAEGARYMLRRSSHRVRQASFDARAAVVTVHRCVVCGLTERDDPRMDFRYCVDCDDHEYCADHLHSHEHIRAGD